MASVTKYLSVPEIPQGEYPAFKNTKIELDWWLGSFLKVRGTIFKEDELAASVLVSVFLDHRFKWAPIEEDAVIRLCESRLLDRKTVFEAIDRFIERKIIRVISVKEARYYIPSPLLVQIVMEAPEKKVLHDAVHVKR